MKRLLCVGLLFMLIYGGCLFAQANPFLIDTSRVLMSEPRNQNAPGTAFDGTDFMVVWSDQRVVGTADIYGCRVNSAGTPLDPVGLTISDWGGAQQDPSVTFGGGNYFVVWSDSRNGQDDIYGARVTPSGEILDPDGIPIATTPGDKWSADVAFGGGVYLVVWVDTRGGQDIYGARVDQSGVLLDPNGLAISTAPSYQEPPHVAFGAADFLVVWEDYRAPNGWADYYGARVSPGGVVLDSNGIAITSTTDVEELYGDVAFDGTNWLAVWMNLSTSEAIYGARISQAGAVLDTNGFQISPTITDPDFSSVVFDGSNYLVAWAQRNSTEDIHAARVTPDGVVLDPTSIPVINEIEDQEYPSVAAGGNNFLIVWQDERENGYLPDIYGARVSSSGTLLDPGGFELGLTTNKQTKPSAAFDGSNYLVAWEDNRLEADSTKIYAMRITPDGTELDAAPLLISDPSGIRAEPSVVFDGINFLIIWRNHQQGWNNPDIYGARITPGGALLDPGGFPIASSGDDEWYPAAVFGGANTLAVWSRRVGNNYHIYGARVTPQGVVLDPSGIPIATASTYHYNPVVAFADSIFLIVYERKNSSSKEDIYCSRLTRDGVVLDPGGIAVCTINNSRQRLPAVSFDGQNFVVAWQDERHDRFNPDIYAARVSPDGLVLEPNGFPVCTAPGKQETPAVIREDTTSMIVWGDFRSGDADLYAARLERSGAIVDTFLLADGASDQTRPKMALGLNQIFTVYEGFTGEVNGKDYNTTRAWGKLKDVSTGLFDQGRSVISGFRLLQNYPNPFNPTTLIGYRLSAAGKVELSIYNILGQKVATLVNERKPAGEYTLQWDASNFPDGMYFYRLKVGPNLIETKKMLLLK